MGKNREDHVRRPAEKKSLLERYDIPVEHLSYEYIAGCKNPKELERIVAVLRSGEEGYYPDLTGHAEKHLAKLKPESSILRCAEPILKRDLLEPDKRTELELDMNKWMCEMKLCEKDLAEGRALLINESTPQPSVRELRLKHSKTPAQSSQNRKNSKRIAACDYDAWDKYDADTELNRIDIQQEQLQVEAKRAQKRLADKEELMKKASKEDIIKQLTMTGTELSRIAEKEREKGNEAFKSGDYAEALNFYHASIAIDATINAYNNRAITYIKLGRYDEAVQDCNKVISMECTNIKAFLRRGLAFERLEKRAQALADYEMVLRLQPTNNIAITAINKLREPCNSRKIRMKIEETATEKTPDESLVETQSQKNKIESSSIPISKALHHRNEPTPSGNRVSSFSANCSTGSKEEKNSERRNEKIRVTKYSLTNEVCFCEKAASSSQYSSPQPHYRGVYCPKESTDEPSTILSMFDAKIPSGTSSSVIIEEIPNEPPYERSEVKNCSTEKNRPPERKGQPITTTYGKKYFASEKTNSHAEIFSQKFHSDANIGSSEKSDNASLHEPKNFENSLNSGIDKNIASEIQFEGTSDPNIDETLHDPRGKSNVFLESEKVFSKSKTARNGDTMLNSESGNNSEINRLSTICNEADKENNDPENINFCTRERTTMYSECTSMKMAFAKPLRSDIEENKLSEKNEEKLIHESDKLRYEKNNIVNPVSSNKNEIATDEPCGKNHLDEDLNLHTLSEKTKLETPYEFLRTWHSIKNDRDLVLHADFLKSTPPEKLSIVLGNKLDGEMLSTIISCLERHFCIDESTTQVELLLNFLQNLGKVERFSIVKMFLNEKDKKALEKIFKYLDIDGFSGDIRALRKMYGTPM